MTSKARPDEYEALAEELTSAANIVTVGGYYEVDTDAVAKLLRDHVEARDAKRDAAWKEALEDQRRQWAAAIQDKLDAYEAKLAEVRAECERLHTLAKANNDFTRMKTKALADRDRTIAEQAAVIEQLRGHWQFLHDTLQEQIVENDQPNRVKWNGEWFDGPPADCYFSTIRIMQKLARTALQETANGK